MIHTKITYVHDVFYIDRDEIADAKNAKEILKKYPEEEEIPIRILEFLNNKENHYCMLLAGEGAMFPWQKGQNVETHSMEFLIMRIGFTRDMFDEGEDLTKYDNFILYDTIIPVEKGESFAKKGAPKYKGLLSLEIYKDLTKLFYDKYY